jgi:hypothetical protein
MTFSQSIAERPAEIRILSSSAHLVLLDPRPGEKRRGVHAERFKALDVFLSYRRSQSRAAAAPTYVITLGRVTFTRTPADILARRDR